MAVPFPMLFVISSIITAALGSSSFSFLFTIKYRMDLSMTWLYAEYTNYLTNRDGENDLVALENYNLCIELILTILTQQKCLTMMSQIIKQAPMLTSRCFSARVHSFDIFDSLF